MINKTCLNMDRLLNELKNGVHSPASLANSLGLSKRQVYRLLESGLKSGEVKKIASGLYTHLFTNVVSYQSLMSNVKMSQSEEHNKTKRDDIDILIPNKIFKEKEFQANQFIQHEEHDNIRAIVTFVCDRAGLIASELEMKRAQRIVRQAFVRQTDIDFLVSHETILEEYAMESVRRMVERLETDSEAIQVNMVTYFFGIFRNVVRADARAWYRQWKALLKERAEVELAVGNEDSVSVILSPESPTYEESSLVDNSNETCVNLEVTCNDAHEFNVPDHWSFIATALANLVEQYSLRHSSVTYQTSIYRLIKKMEQEHVEPSQVQRAIDDVVEHDVRATEYLVRLIKTGLVDEAISQLERHYARSKTRINVSSGSSSKTEVNSSIDERYLNFYRLFPNG